MKCKNQVILAIAIILFIIFIGTDSIGATAIVNVETLNLRKEASTDSTILTQLDKEDKLDIIEKSGDWIKVKVNGTTGFVHKDYVQIYEEEKAEIPKAESKENEVENNIVVEETTTNNSEIIQTNTTIIREETLKNDTDVSILPLINANKIANVKKDTKVTVMDEVKGWLYIQTEEVNGWIRSNIVVENIQAENNTTNNVTTENNNEDKEENTENEKIEEVKIEEKIMYVNYSSIYIRKGPGTENEVVDTLILNSQVVVTAESGDWYKVKVDGKEGYIAKRLLSNKQTESTTRSADEREEASQEESQEQVVATTATSKGQEIVNYAKQFLGCKYVYGGSGPSTFDCSGFTMYVFKKFGILLSHSARAQSKNGTYVSKEDLQPGDLVFFKDYETMDGIGHCGIYVGDGNFIHASSGTGYCVKISTLLSGSYYNRYETARRLI